MDEIDPGELLRFQGALLSELERLGFILIRFTDEGFEVAGPGGKRYAKAATFFKMHKQGAGVAEIADLIANAKGREESLRPKVEDLTPFVKGPDFILAYQKTIERSLGRVGPDHPSLPVIIRPWRGHDVYVLCAIDIGYGFTYLLNGSFKGLGISHKELYGRMIESLDRRISAIISEKRYKHLKQAEGVHSIAFPEDLAPSFLLVAERHFDFLESVSGIIGAEFFYALTVTTEEILILGPSVPMDLLAFAVKRTRERQEELGARAEVHQIVSIEPVVITKKGVTFITR